MKPGVTCGCGKAPVHSTTDTRFHPEQGYEEHDGTEIEHIVSRSRKQLVFEMTTGPYLRLIVEGLKEHEANEIRDLLRSRGWVE